MITDYKTDLVAAIIMMFAFLAGPATKALRIANGEIAAQTPAAAEAAEMPQMPPAPPQPSQIRIENIPVAYTAEVPPPISSSAMPSRSVADSTPLPAETAAIEEAPATVVTAQGEERERIETLLQGVTREDGHKAPPYLFADPDVALADLLATGEAVLVLQDPTKKRTYLFRGPLKNLRYIGIATEQDLASFETTRALPLDRHRDSLLRDLVRRDGKIDPHDGTRTYLILKQNLDQAIWFAQRQALTEHGLQPGEVVTEGHFTPNRSFHITRLIKL